MIAIKTDAPVIPSSLQKKILRAADLPLPARCPTALRYELACFDADDIADAYAAILVWEKNGYLQPAD